MLVYVLLSYLHLHLDDDHGSYDGDDVGLRSVDGLLACFAVQVLKSQPKQSS